MAANDEHETAAHIKRLTEEISNLQQESNELTCEYFSPCLTVKVFPENFITARIEAIKRKEGNEREALKRKHAEEVQFLKVTTFA